MTFKSLLDAWAAEQEPARTSETYSVHLSTEDAARVHALAELFPGVSEERVITDLLSVALEQVEAAIPYVPGNKVIREDDFGDPVYEDKGLTPQFLDLVKRYRRQLES
ncbi:MAG TPA: type 1 pili tip component [Woeseiaceae bacterium]|nr:type 1 pili tip component [Woeseiaceae bacterium]